jgi:WD40 repeat protein
MGELKGFPNEVKCVAWSPDSKLIAGAGTLNEVWVWAVRSGELLAKLNNGTMVITNGLDFSPDGKILAAGGSNGEVKLWDIAEKKVVLSMKTKETNTVRQVAFSPNGKQLLAVSGGISLLNVSDGSLEYSTPETVWTVRWSRDGKQIFECGPAGFCVRDTASGKLIQQSGQRIEQDQRIMPGGRIEPGRRYELSPDGKTAAAGFIVDLNAKLCEVRIFNTSTGAMLRALSITEPEWIVPNCYTSDGKYLFAVSRMNVIVFNMLSGTFARILTGDPHEASGFRFAKLSPDDRAIAVVNLDSTIKLLAEQPAAPKKK